MIKQVLKKVFVSSNIFISIALCLGVLGAYVSPQQIPQLVLLNLGLPYLVALNAISLLFWLLLKHKYALISTFSLLLSFPLISNSIKLLPSNINTNSNNSFNILSYNVRVFDLYNWSNNKVTRNNIFQLVRTKNPEVACFQEFFNSTNASFPVHDSLINNQNFKYAHTYYNVKLNNGHKFGIATYSVHPIIRKEEVIFKRTHNLAIISDIKIGTDTIRVINCHLESVRFLETDYHFIDSVTLLSEKRRIEGFKGVTKRLLNASIKRALQAEEINQLALESPLPTIICGDINDTPYSYTYSKISYNLTDSFKKHKPGIGGTYTRFIPPLRIDHIFHNNNIECTKFNTIKSNYSDHYPIMGSYKIIK